jgi:protocatechuate 3,4-dioxygenase beta subunit
MNSLMLRLTVATALLLPASALEAQRGAPTAQPRDPQARAQQREAVGTASIAGLVTMAASGQPARKVRINLSGPELRGGRTATSDDQGRFSFTALPAGRYNLSANKPGHLSVTYGQRRPGTQGTMIQLGDGQKFEAHLQIPRGSVLTGMVLDEHGEPTPGTNVRAMRLVTQGGDRRLQSAGSGSTDDRGIYRIFGLQPADYVICATPRNQPMPDGMRIRAQVEAMRAELQALRAQGRQDVLGALQERLASLETMAAAQPEESPAGYAPICYPGALSTTEATPVPLGVGEERTGIDFQLRLVPMARVEGMIINSTGQPLQNVQVTLQHTVSLGPGVGTTQSARADGEGRFRFNAVPPGQYTLAARGRAGGPGGRAGQRGALQLLAPGGRGRGAPAAQRPEPIMLWGAVDLAVDGRTVENVMVPLSPGMTVSGQVTFQGSSAPPADLTRVRVTLSSAEPGPLSNNAAGRADANGRFTIANVMPGRYRVNASGAQGWFLESASVGGQDALDFPFEVKGNQQIGSVVVTFTDRSTELTGTVVDDSHQPAVDYTLIIFPSDSRYWTAGSRRIQTVRPATDGRYTLRNLPPGDYRIATVLDLEPGAASDPAFLQQLEAVTMQFTLSPGEKKQQDIRLSVR